MVDRAAHRAARKMTTGTDSEKRRREKSDGPVRSGINQYNTQSLKPPCTTGLTQRWESQKTSFEQSME
eukprot:6852082-Alexandrium_andersonii.AAC.1